MELTLFLCFYILVMWVLLCVGTRIWSKRFKLIQNVSTQTDDNVVPIIVIHPNQEIEK